MESEFQLIAGTNRDLGLAVRSGRFREDLLARLNLWTFRLPGLRDRKEDIEHERDHREVACNFFRKEATAADGCARPATLGIHLLFRDDPQAILRNVVDLFDRAILSPTELVCRAV